MWLPRQISKSAAAGAVGADLSVRPQPSMVMKPTLIAGGRDPVQGTRLHLVVDECAGRSDALTDVVGQPQRLARIDDFDSRRTFCQKTRSPSAGRWCRDAGRILQPE